MPETTRRRFIAGAVCPRCGLMDKIVVDLETDERACVSCGFSDARPEEGAAKGGVVQVVPEVLTRVSRAAARRVETPAEAITFIEPDKSDD
jgi:uncharacterized metal-binding protein (TIGR02443 family)